jgi:hypothetical protein
MTAIKLAIEALEGAQGAKLSDGTYLDKDCKITMALAALRAQPNHSVVGNTITEVDPFSVTGIPVSPHRELIAELRKPMHYLSMSKRNRAADALEGKVV